MTDKLDLFTPSQIRSGMRVRKLTRPYWNGYPELLDTYISPHKTEVCLLEPDGTVNESLTPERFCKAVNLGGLVIANNEPVTN